VAVRPVNHKAMHTISLGPRHAEAWTPTRWPGDPVGVQRSGCQEM